MPYDFFNPNPNTDPTQGLQEAAPIAPYVPSSLSDVVGNDLLRDTKFVLDRIQGQPITVRQIDPDSGEVTEGVPKIAPEQLRREFPGVTGINEAMPREVAVAMQRDQQNAARRADVDARYPTELGATAARFGAGLVTGLLDPVDDAAFMVPVVGESRYAAWLARAGEEAGMAGRAAVTAGVGALRGGAGSAILATGKGLLGDPDMSLGEGAYETLTGAVAGGVLHAATSFRHDIMGARFFETPEGQAALAQASVHDNATRVAAAQMAYDSPVEVRPVFDAARDMSSRAELMSGTALNRTMGAPVYLESAVAEAKGRPNDDQTRANNLAQQAKSAPPAAVLDGRMSEAEHAIEQLRAAGALTPEEEAELAAFEPNGIDGKGGARDRTVAVPEAERATVPNVDAPPLAAVAGEPVAVYAGGLPDVMGERVSEPSKDNEHDAASAANALTDAGEGIHRDIADASVPEAQGREFIEQTRDAAFDRALTRAAAREEGREMEPERQMQNLPALRRAVSDLRDGKLSNEEFQRQIENMLERMENRRAEQDFAGSGEPTRGPDYIRQRLLEAKRRGDISNETADMAEWFIQKNPRLVDDLGISIRKPNERGTAGMYNSIERVMTLFKGSAKDTTAVHEMLHHLERMMPDDVQADIRNEWSRAITAEMVNGSDAMREYLTQVLAANEGRSATLLDAARQLLPSTDAYQYLNPSEFWAVNATRIMAARFDAQSSLGARLRQWFGELLQRVRGWIGMRSDAPMLRALSEMINNGNGDASGQMLSRFRSFGDLADKVEETGAENDPAQAALRAKQKLTAIQDIIKRKAMLSKIDTIKGNGLTLTHGLDSLTRGISEAVPGARDSTAQHQLANQEFLMGRLVGNLEAIPGGMEAWRGATLTQEWVREMAELNKKEGGKPGISKSPLALELAKAVHDAQDIARLNLNRAGAWIGDYDGYVSRTMHDPIKIHNAGYAQWSSDVMGLLDRDKTFADLLNTEDGMTDPVDSTSTFDRVDQDQIDEYLRNTWDALSTGIHMSSDHGVDPKAAAFPGPANMARQASAGRVLHWKDADAWMQYQQKYGDPVIERGVMEGLYRAGRDTALMQRWGSNPKMAFETLIQQVRQKYRSDHEAVAHLDKSLPRIREEFAHLTGEAARPQSALASQIRGSILAMQDVTKLGNVLLAHLSTTLTKPFQLQYLGVGRWRAYFSVLANLAKDTTPEGKQLLENLRANATGQFQDLIGGYEPIDGVPGQLARLRQFSMRIGGLPWMLARQKAGTMWEVANFLGQNVGKSFDQLDGRTARGLSIYGITPTEWDILRNAPDHDQDAAGSTFLTPAAANRANIDPLIGEELKRARDPEDIERIRTEARDRLAMKLAAYYGDAADRSTITPGVQERAFFSRHAGRTWGPLVGQYKTWAMAAVRTMWGQAIHGSGTRAEAVKYLAELSAVGMAIGFARLAITDAANGLEPDLPNGDFQHDAALTTKAAVAGGAMGIMGDYLMGQYARTGETSSDRAKDLALNILGPAFADIAQTYGLAHEYGAIPFANDAGHALDRADADGMHFLTSHLPLANTFYLRLLSRWLVLDQLNEMADPGYLQRHMNAVRERTGQEYYMAPTNYVGAA